MGLKAELVADIAEALNGDLRDAVSEFEGKRVKAGQTGKPSYNDWLNQANGSAPTSTTITYSGKGIFDNYNAYEVNNETILATDINLICLQSHVTNTPEPDDKINGYSVIAVRQDPVSATFDIQLRKV